MNQRKEIQKRIIEEISKDEAVEALFSRIEKEHESRVKRLVRQAEHEGNFHLTLILENYEMLELTLKPTRAFGLPGLEVEVEVW